MALKTPVKDAETVSLGLQVNHGSTAASWREILVNPSSFFAQVSSTFLAKVLISAIAVITTAAISRLLGPAGRGEYAAAMALGTIGVQIANLGLHASNTYTVASRPSLLPQVLGNTLAVSFVSGGLATVIISSVFFHRPGLQPVHGWMLYLALGWIPVGLAFLLLQSLLLGTGEIMFYNVTEIATRFAVLVTLIVLAQTDFRDANGFFVATTACFATGAVLMFGKLFRKAGRLATSGELLSENLHYGFKAYLAALFSFIVLRIDLLMVKDMLGAEPAGYYSVSVTLGEMIMMIPTVIGSLLFPKLSGMSSDDERWRLAKKTFRWTALVMPIVIVASALMARPLVLLLFGRDFYPAIPAFQWLLPGLLALSMSVLCMNYFASLGMPWVTVYAPLTAAVINCSANLWFIPHYGIAGASICSSLSYGLLLIISLTYLLAERAKVRRVAVVE
jgi:O-antigen/teichoic acid export membrane protein